jgi:hypothetical protein
MVVAVCAVVLSSGGSALAAKTLVTSSSQVAKGAINSGDVADGTLRPADLSPAARAATTGPAGPQGPAGERGPAGGVGRRALLPGLLGRVTWLQNVRMTAIRVGTVHY